MSYSQHVTAEDTRRCLEVVRDILAGFQPGFLLLTDLSSLESMDASCSQDLGTLMDMCDAKGLETVVRVIPDPSKDIGFAIISRFHHHPRVQTRTYDNLADAVQSLSDQIPKIASQAAASILDSEVQS